VGCVAQQVSQRDASPVGGFEVLVFIKVRQLRFAFVSGAPLTVTLGSFVLGKSGLGCSGCKTGGGGKAAVISTCFFCGLVLSFLSKFAGCWLAVFACVLWVSAVLSRRVVARFFRALVPSVGHPAAFHAGGHIGVAVKLFGFGLPFFVGHGRGVLLR